ncbi:MAG TPA: VOC family protein [Candidatus Angelobacter sp.]|jgi:catechol 2,3-dioxygenase-like lactoylglutathione lyase family enzyme|nr:VOC family protein [Candidatus Angelobacter sp.]
MASVTRDVDATAAATQLAARALPTWRGVNHLALVTPDMDATVRFYHGVLGMPLVATLMAGPMRHYFFKIDESNTVAFFEWQGSDTFRKPAGWPTHHPLQFDHLSFNLPDRAALLDMQDRLRSAGTEVTEVVDHGMIKSIYFTDPCGIALEASYWETDATAQPAGNQHTFLDPNPVPALRELLETGQVRWVPQTDLVDAPVGIS